MPKEQFGEKYVFLPREALLTFEEIVRVARAAAALGVRKLRITGGEPLLRRDLPSLIAMLRAIDSIEDIALTTNGILLPKCAAALREAGLDRITVSLDSLDDAVYQRMNGLDEPVVRVLEGITAAECAGFGPLKINAVIQRGVNDHTVLALAEHFRGTGHVLRFIEYMDVGTLNQWDRRQVLPSAELAAQLATAHPLQPLAQTRAEDTATRQRYADGQGELGFISSVTQPFCGNCTRLRLSADGSLYTCLFATQGTDLRAPLRSGITDATLQSQLADLWRARTDRYSELRAQSPRQASAPREKVEMYHIGG